jgi:hypothetical protein
MVAGSPGLKLPGKSQRKTEPLISARNTAIGTHVRKETPAFCWEMCNLSQMSHITTLTLSPAIAVSPVGVPRQPGRRDPAFSPQPSMTKFSFLHLRGWLQ